LAFSTHSSNLWHQTTRRGADAGHGVAPTANGSRLGSAGGSSYYFGRENQGNYDVPGGAAGAMESKTFSLAGITSGDAPTLYFNYFLNTEAAESDLATGSTPTDYMRDAFRVYISGDDGQWVLAATNNDPAQAASNGGLLDDELDPLLTDNADVQRLFDNTGSWRQARVPLARFAGQENVKIRIEFSSAGSFGYGLTGGKGPEIRTIAGSKLVDGQSLVVNGQVFEIEMGPTLAMPSGNAIADGDFVVVDGNRFVFTRSGGVAAPAIAVPYSTTMTAVEVASALAAAVNSNAQVITTTAGLAYNHESNDLISLAETTGVTGSNVRMTGNGVIGDNPNLADDTQDVDFVRIDATRGATVTVEVKAAILGSPLDSFLRVFDDSGNPLVLNGVTVQNDNSPGGSSDSRLTFVVPRSGSYYIGLSSAGNSTYNANVGGNTTPGSSTGSYTLDILITRDLTAYQDGNRIQLSGAENVQLGGASSIELQGSFGTTGLPLFMNLEMTAQEVAVELQRAIADFFANGVANVYPVRGGDIISLTGLTVQDGGPFGLTTSFVGDDFSAFNSGTNFQGLTPNAAFPGSLQSQQNNFEGAYVDDFVIGLAGRGEIFTGQTNADTSFVADPSLTITNPDKVNTQIKVGPYQLEIRGGQEYGIPQPALDPVTILNDRVLGLDERMSQGISIRFQDSSSFITGSTFTLTSGPVVLTFELDDENDAVSVQPGNIALPFNTLALDTNTGARYADSAADIAARFRDLVNSPAVQRLLNGSLAVNLLNGDRGGATSDTVVLIGKGDVQIPAEIGTRIVSNGKGGSNRERPQGQVVINAARVSNSLSFGASVTTAPRDPATQAPLPGSPRNTVTINNERLAPGAAIINSEFLFNLSGGINIVGDSATATQPPAAVPFVRLVNNTIVGGNITTISSTTPLIQNGFVFDTGALAFADRVSAFVLGTPTPITGLVDGSQALGLPNYSGNGEPVVSQPSQGSVSLGRGGSITLQFTDNFLTGSNNADPDLAVFEVGDSEEVSVEVSADGVNWRNVGRASGNSPTIDLDAFGYNSNSRLVFVRLIDIVNQGSLTGNSVGADIDAVGAISSVPVDKYAPRGNGISVTNNATATLLNNVVINNAVGINVDNSSSSTVVGGSVFQFNSSNIGGSATVGQYAQVLPDTVPVFVSPGRMNLYPSSASPVIDSSIDSLEDRASLVAVKRPLGLAASPILAPQLDVDGQLRVDDPAVETPAGLGENVFKDRGAQERADFVGPSVVLQNPVDNDLAGLDLNPDPTVVELVGVTPGFFDIRLIDGLEPSDPNRGTGIDPATVSSSSVLVFRNGVPLVEGVDYRFGFDETNGVIRLQSLAGIWRGQSEYTIRFVNSRESAIVARAGSGYLDGDKISIIDAANSLTNFEIELGYLVDVPALSGTSTLVDGATFTIDDGTRKLTFEIDTNNSVTSGSVAVRPVNELVGSVTDALVSAINSSGLKVNAAKVNDGRLQIQGTGTAPVVVAPLDSKLVVTGKIGVQGAFGIQIPLVAGVPTGINDGQTFTINRGSGPVTFELDTNGTVSLGNVRVSFAAGATAAQIGAALVAAIDNANLGLSPVYDGNGIVRLGGDANTVLNLTQSVLTQIGTAGEQASVPVRVPFNAIATQVAALIRTAIESANLSGISITSFGSRLIINNAVAVSGVGGGVIGSIRDMAGNTIKPNQTDGTTTATVFLGNGLDYGDAPTPYASTDLQNGPRHKVISGLSLGTRATADTDARIVTGDSADDGVTFSALYAAFGASTTISVNNTTGSQAFIMAWIDFNGDGVFATSEALSASPVAVTGSSSRTFNFEVPQTAKAGTTYARVRLSTDSSAILLPTGSAPNGEVEDYRLNLQGNPFTNSVWNLDVNRDGKVSPIDALQVINYLNDPTKSKVLFLNQATFNPPFVDVSGDGRVTAQDALAVINYLNDRSAITGEGEGEGEPANDVVANGSSQSDVMAGDWAGGYFASRQSDTNRQAVSNAAGAQVSNDLAIGQVDLIGDTATHAGWQVGGNNDQYWGELGSSDLEESSLLGLDDDLLDNLL
jgi:large repetitive protein